MDRKSKELKRAWQEGERAAMRAQFPLEVDELEAMFADLRTALAHERCDHSRRLTTAWLEAHGHDVPAVLAWCDKHSGFCDCEVLTNVRQVFDRAKGAPAVH